MSDMAVLSPYQFTVADYHRIAESGALDDARVELIDGIIAEMSPIGNRHWARHARITQYLSPALAGHAFLVPQGSFPLGDKNEPQPDFAILAPGDWEAAARYPAPDEIYALIELSDSSLAKDTGPKLRIYGRFGIPNYLVVDLAANILVHSTEPYELGYRRSDRLAHGDTFRLARLPDIALDASSFLQP